MAISTVAVGTSRDNLVQMPTPDTFTWGISDVSSSDSGRVEDANATMYKMKVTSKRKISLGWTDPDATTVATLLQAFSPEYVYVRYRDAMSNAYETREFYSGDKSAPLKQITVSGATYSSLTFNIIER